MRRNWKAGSEKIGIISTEKISSRGKLTFFGRTDYGGATHLEEKKKKKIKKKNKKEHLDEDRQLLRCAGTPNGRSAYKSLLQHRHGSNRG